MGNRELGCTKTCLSHLYHFLRLCSPLPLFPSIHLCRHACLNFHFLHCCYAPSLPKFNLIALDCDSTQRSIIGEGGQRRPKTETHGTHKSKKQARTHSKARMQQNQYRHLLFLYPSKLPITQPYWYLHNMHAMTTKEKTLQQRRR